jgi:predicted DNA-binding transcriptional regulator AlpA
MFPEKNEQPIEPLLWTPRQTARALHISEKNLWLLSKAGDIPTVRFGKRNVRYSPSDLTAWIASAKKSKAGA